MEDAAQVIERHVMGGRRETYKVLLTSRTQIISSLRVFISTSIFTKHLSFDSIKSLSSLSTMSRQIRNLLYDDFTPATYNGEAQSSTLHEKAFARNMAEVTGYFFRDTNMATLDTVLGPEFADDEERIDKPLPFTFPDQPEYVTSEGDSTRMYHEYLSSPVKTAWRSFPRIIEANQAGPMGQTSFTGTVDCRFTYGSSTLLIGELKKPGTITSNWSDPSKTNTTKSRLGKELRGYTSSQLKARRAC